MTSGLDGGKYPLLLEEQQFTRPCEYLEGPWEHWVLGVDINHKQSSGPSLNLEDHVGHVTP